MQKFVAIAPKSLEAQPIQPVVDTKNQIRDANNAAWEIMAPPTDEGSSKADSSGKQRPARSTTHNQQGGMLTLVPQLKPSERPPQIILGGSQSAPSIISGPNGTLVLNSGLQNYGQNFILQGNNLVGNMGPVQLTLRAPSPQMVSVSSSTNQSSMDSSIMNAINTSVSSPMMSRGPQPTFVMSNQGPMFVPRGQNIVINRSPFMPGPPPGTQFLQIQTPNGPMMIALQTQPQVFPPVQSTLAMSTSAPHPQFVHPGGPTTLQTLFDPRTHMISSSPGPMIISQNVQPCPSPAPVPSTPPAPAKGKRNNKKKEAASTPAPKSVNLGDLLKETGILPDSSPSTSPSGSSSQKNLDCDEVTNLPPASMMQPIQQHPMFMVPQSSNRPNIVLAPSQTPQLRLALTPDGNVVLQHTIPDQGNLESQIVSSEPVATTSKLFENVKDSSGPGSSQPSPDSTTPTLDSTLVAPSTPSTTRNFESKKSEKRDSKEMDAILPVTVENLNGSVTSDSNDSKAVIVVAAPKPCPDEPVVSGTPIIDSTGAVQISLNNHEFLERLDSQIKELTSLKTLTPQQEQLLQEFTKLQNTISEARKQSTLHQCQLQQQQQQSQVALVSTQVTNTPNSQLAPSQQPAGVQLVNLLKPPTPTQQIRLIPSPSVVTSQPGATYQLGSQLITISATSSCASVPTITAAVRPQPVVVQAPQPASQSSPVRVPTPKSPTKPVKDSHTERDKLRLKINKL